MPESEAALALHIARSSLDDKTCVNRVLAY